MIGSALVGSQVPSPNFEARTGFDKPDLLILHYTGMETAAKSCSWLCNPESRVSCHYLVDEDGAIIQMVSEDMRAWHAGVSSWHGQIDTNSRSIGIEIHNPGHFGGYPDFPLVQMDVVAELCRDIVSRHGMRPENVLAHSDVAPGRKIDPGEKFDWQFLHARGIGHWVPPLPLQEGRVLRAGDEGEAVLELQRKLLSYGYGLAESGVFDQQTHIVVEAFQRHFRQARVDGAADISTIGTLHKLIDGLCATA